MTVDKFMEWADKSIGRTILALTAVGVVITGIGTGIVLLMYVVLSSIWSNPSGCYQVTAQSGKTEVLYDSGPEIWENKILFDNSACWFCDVRYLHSGQCTDADKI